MGATFTPVTQSAVRDNSDFLSSTSNDGRSGWSQAKDFLDSNWLTSMASYMLPGIGTARTADDAITNFSNGKIGAGLLDTLFTALSVIPGAGALAGIAKGGKGIGGALKGIKAGSKAADAAADVASGLAREGSIADRWLQGAKTAETNKKAAQDALDTFRSSGLKSAKDESKAAFETLSGKQKGLTEAEGAFRAAEDAAAAKYADDLAKFNNGGRAAEQARLDQQYLDDLENLLSSRGYYRPAGKTAEGFIQELGGNAVGRAGTNARRNLANELLARGARPTNTGDALAKFGRWDTRGASATGNPVALSGGRTLDSTADIATELRSLEDIDALLKDFEKIKSGRGTPVAPTKAPVSSSEVDKARKAVEGASEEFAKKQGTLSEALEKEKDLQEALRRASASGRSSAEIENILSILSAITEGTRIANPWIRGIIGQGAISPYALSQSSQR